MTHPIHRVVRFAVVAPFTLDVAFADGAVQRIAFRQVLAGPLFGPLQDLATFNAVVLDTEAGTLVWPNGADFDPATLHAWPEVREELASRARRWAATADCKTG
jgi:hypothetical protein